jgi:hypothetical protein
MFLPGDAENNLAQRHPELGSGSLVLCLINILPEDAEPILKHVQDRAA